MPGDLTDNIPSRVEQLPIETKNRTQPPEVEWKKYWTVNDIRCEVIDNTSVQKARRTQESKMLKVALGVGTACVSLNQLQKEKKEKTESRGLVHTHCWALLGVGLYFQLRSDDSAYVTALDR